MANKQRKESDKATDNRRELADKTRKDNRDRNDELTQARRIQADKVMNENRVRNDEMTANRRRINDRNPWKTLAISLLIIAILAIGAYYFLFAR